MSLLWTFHTQTNIRDVNRRRENHVSFKKSETANEDDETDEISNCESNVDILLRKREDNEAYDRYLHLLQSSTNMG
ncbi:uncharacterized protein OCT59_011263 [Rhizophagus irregularis]|uniref:uncharacterized protein n=1 Tax=Rhizophagus irregularis TaxID=588596 RepID=UPI00332483AA|nr:hypothetical protein OCT59_011263 [Rhizophagus irregularis]